MQRGHASVHAGLLRTQSKAQHVLKHIESNVETELDGWTVRHAAGSLRSAYAEVRQDWPPRTIPYTRHSCLGAAQPFACLKPCLMLPLQHAEQQLGLTHCPADQP